MIFNLTRITKQSRTYYFHISFTCPDGTIRYIEMRLERLEKKTKCSYDLRTKKCSAGLFASFREPIKTQPTDSKYYAFTDDKTDEMILNKDDHMNSSQRHISKCYARITFDGLCDSTKHDPDCYKKWISKSK